jgi:hypothetical protein
MTNNFAIEPEKQQREKNIKKTTEMITQKRMKKKSS